MARTLFTSRAGGDLKLAAHRERLRQTLALDSLHFMHQTHSDLVRIVGADGGEFECDAMVTTARGVGLAALAADCMPVIFTSSNVVGVAHVGRVGLVAGIAPKVVEVMRDLGAEEIEVRIGPSICSRCYEVSTDMYQEIVSKISATKTTIERRTLDLQGGLRSQLIESGVSFENIRSCEMCTLESALYFSYRGGDLSARQAGIVSL